MNKKLLSSKFELKYRFFRFDSPLNGARKLYFFNIVRWKITTLHLLFKKREKFSLPVQYEPEKLKFREDFFCILGHGTILFQINGKRIITDPVFGNIPFYKRYTPFPYSLSEIGKIDYVLISHSHYDHFDIPSLKKIKQVEKVIVPLKVSKYLKNIFPYEKICELNWFEEFSDNGFKITFLPAKHWSKRRIFDTNTTLWGSLLIQFEKANFYYAVDTAYSYHFKEIGKMFKIDYAFLPVGAYKPDYIMKHNHLNPDEAYSAFKDLKAGYFVPIHFGVFKLSDEPVSEPYQILIKKYNTPQTLIPSIGTVVEV